MDQSAKSSIQSKEELKVEQTDAEILKEAQASFSLLPYTDSLELRDFLHKDPENANSCELTEKNIKRLKELRKYLFSIGS
jgi:hypothetical protein